MRVCIDMHKLSNSIELLPIHLENEQNIYYDSENEDEDDLIDKIDRDTKLTAYFKYNKIHFNDLNFVPYTYSEFPTFYTWNRKNVCGQLEKVAEILWVFWVVYHLLIQFTVKNSINGFYYKM